MNLPPLNSLRVVANNASWLGILVKTLTMDVPSWIFFVEHAAIVASIEASRRVVSPTHSPSKPFSSARRLTSGNRSEESSPFPLNMRLVDIDSREPSTSSNKRLTNLLDRSELEAKLLFRYQVSTALRGTAKPQPLFIPTALNRVARDRNQRPLIYIRK